MRLMNKRLMLRNGIIISMERSTFRFTIIMDFSKALSKKEQLKKQTIQEEFGVQPISILRLSETIGQFGRISILK